MFQTIIAHCLVGVAACLFLFFWIDYASIQLLQTGWVYGYAVPFGNVYTVRGGWERIEPGTLNWHDDNVEARFTHEPQQKFATALNIGLPLFQDRVGFAFELTLPSTWASLSLANSICHGDFRGASVEFEARKLEPIDDDVAWQGRRLPCGPERRQAAGPQIHDRLSRHRRTQLVADLNVLRRLRRCAGGLLSQHRTRRNFSRRDAELLDNDPLRSRQRSTLMALP